VDRLSAHFSTAQTVTHEPWISNTSQGRPTFGASSTYKAAVKDSIESVRDQQGEVVTEKGTVVSFLEPVAANGSLGRDEPIDPRDRITLPDGQVGVVRGVEGLVDPGTGYPYLPVVTLGF